MEILKIIETLQSYTEDVVAYKLDRPFAHAVSEAVSMLVAQGERIAELEDQNRWVPVTERLPEEDGRYYCNVKSFAFPGSFYHAILWGDKHGFRDGNIYEDGVTHWMPLHSDPPKGD